MTERAREGENGLEGASMSVDRHVLPGESVCGGDIVCGSCAVVCVVSERDTEGERDREGQRETERVETSLIRPE